MSETNPDYWYENRHLLEEGQVFRTVEGEIVRLTSRVPGDGTDWQVDEKWGDRWWCVDSTIHPGDLAERILTDK